MGSLGVLFRVSSHGQIRVLSAFFAEIFTEQYYRLFNPLFSMYFVHFQNLSIKVPAKFENYMKFIENFRSIISNVRIS